MNGRHQWTATAAIAITAAMLLGVLAACGGQPPARQQFIDGKAVDDSQVTIATNQADPEALQPEISVADLTSHWTAVRPYVVERPTDADASLGRRALAHTEQQLKNGGQINLLVGYFDSDPGQSMVETNHLNPLLYLERQPDGSVLGAVISIYPIRGDSVDPRDVGGFNTSSSGAFTALKLNDLARSSGGPYDELLYAVWWVTPVQSSCEPTEASLGCLYLPAEYQDGELSPRILTGDARIIDIVTRSEHDQKPYRFWRIGIGSDDTATALRPVGPTPAAHDQRADDEAFSDVTSRLLVGGWMTSLGTAQLMQLPTFQPA